MIIFDLKVTLSGRRNHNIDRQNVQSRNVLKIISVLKATLKDLHPPK
jgi:hypothetical protein